MKFTKRLASLLVVLCLLCSPVLSSLASAAQDAAEEEKEPVSTWDAQWIWDKDNSTRYDTWMNFRKTVELDEVPEQVTARIAVDSRYWLYINGEMVVFEGALKRGPTPEDSYYDSVDITKYLHTGTNTIAVQVWYWGRRDGVRSYSNVDSGQGGFLFEAELGENCLKSDSSWKVKMDPAHLRDTVYPQPNYRIPESNIMYDARLEDENWMQPDFDDSDWANATEYGQAPCAPWNQLYERSIPLLKDFGLKEYENMDDYRNYTTTAQETLTMKIPYNAQMTPYLKVEAPAGLEIQMTTENTGIGAVRSTYITKEGEQEFEALGWFNGENVNYRIPAGVKIISLQYRESGYNTEFEGSFTSDNEFYNKLWQMSQRTLYVTMRDNYMDCPDRERAQWWGDVTNEMMMMMYALDEQSYQLYEKGLTSKLGFLDENTNVLQTVVPIQGDYFELPMQELAGVCGYWEYYLYTGKTDILEMMYEPSKNYLNLWEMGDNGLVIHRGGSWDWPDWGSNSDVPALENAWYYKALTAVKQMAQELGHDEDIPAMEERLLSIQMNYNSFWTEDGFKSTNQARPDDRANAVALLAGLVDKSQYPAVREVLNTVENASPYMEKYVLDALCEMGYMEDAQDRMVRRYTPMVNDNYSTLWEVWDKNGGTRNHAWSGGPLISMSKYMAGVAPLSAGYDSYQVKPDLGELNQASVSVPSVKGDIVVDITRDPEAKTLSMNLVSPAETQAVVAVPRFAGENMRVTVGGTVVFENGAAAGTVDGFTYTSNDANYIYFNAAPGTWEITADVLADGTENEYALNITGSAGGQVLVDGTAVDLPYSQTVPAGTEVTVQAVPDSKYDFAGWSGSIGSNDDLLTLKVNNNLTLNAGFSLKPVKEYSRIVLSNPDNADVKVEYDGRTYSLPASIVVKNGQKATLKAVDGENFRFMNWEGDRFSANRTIDLSMEDDVNLSLNTAYASLTNVALGATVTTTDSMEAAPTWSRNNLTDGNVGSKYTTNIIKNVGENGDISDSPQDLTFDFGSAKSFDTVTIYPRTDASTADGKTPNFPKEFLVQVSDDGANYTDAKHVVVEQNPEGQAQTFDVGSQKARFMRIRVLRLGDLAGDEGVANAYRIQLNEIMAYSRAVDPSQEYTLTLKKSGSGSAVVLGNDEEMPMTKSYPAGSVVAIEAVPDDMNQFTGWSGNVSTSDRLVYVVMNQDINLTASFKSLTNDTTNENLALNRKVNTNDSYNGSGWDSSYLTDGQFDCSTTPKGYTSNPYPTQTPANPISVEIDLGRITTLNQVVLYPRRDVSSVDGEGTSPNYPDTFKIQVKGEDGEYRDVYSVEGADNPNNQPVTYNFDSQSARYVRLYVTKLGKAIAGENQMYVQLEEMEVYNNYRNPENIARGKEVTSNQPYIAAPSWTYENLVDGKLTSEGKDSPSGIKGFTTNGSSNRDVSANPFWVQVNFGAVNKLNYVELYPRTDVEAIEKGSGVTANFPEDFTIQTSTNGKDFTVVYTATGVQNQRGPYVCEFDTVEAQYVRVVVTKLGYPTWDEGSTAAGTSRLQLAELRAGNVSNDPPKMGDIKIETDGASTALTVGEQLPISAVVTPSSLSDNSVYWTIEDSDGTPSEVADLLNTDTETPTIVARSAGKAYVVARFANGLPATAILSIEVKDKPAIDTDKSILKYVLDYAQAQIDAGRTEHLIPLVQAKFTGAFEHATNVYGDPTVTQQEVDEAWVLLMNAIHMLDFQKGDKEALIVSITAAQGLDLDLYGNPQADKDAVTAALKAAIVVRDDENALQGEIDAAREALDAAVAKLVLKNTSVLEAAIRVAETYDLSLYIEAGQAEFVTALKAANDVLADKASTQEEIDQAADDLLIAMMNLRYKADKSILEKVVAAVANIDLSGYTSESVDWFNRALDAANSLLSDQNLEATDENNAAIQAAADELEAAYKALTPLRAADLEGDAAVTASGGTAKTGDANTAAAAAAMLLLAGAAFVLTKKQK